MNPFYKNLILLISLTTGVRISQAQYKKNITWSNKRIQSALQNSHGDYLAFQYDDQEDLNLSPDSQTVKAKNLGVSTYDFDFLGDKILYEQQFDTFPYTYFIQTLDSFRHRRCDYHMFKGKIYRDSIALEVQAICDTVDDENRHFLPIVRRVDYPGGEKAFSEYLARQLGEYADSLHNEKDSLFYFKTVITKTGKAEQAKLISPGNHKFFTGKIIEAINRSNGWTPPELGGIKVKIYIDVFVRLRRDGSIEADYQGYY